MKIFYLLFFVLLAGCAHHDDWGALSQVVGQEMRKQH